MPTTQSPVSLLAAADAPPPNLTNPRELMQAIADQVGEGRWWREDGGERLWQSFI